MKYLFSLVIVWLVAFAGITSVDAHSHETKTPITLSGLTLSGQYKNKEAIMKEVKEHIKNQREMNKSNSGAMISSGQLACVRTALVKRESAILAASTVHAAATNSGLTTRASSLYKAWTLANNKERKAAINSAWDSWENLVKSASDIHKKARDAAWNTFRTEVKACKSQEALVDSDRENR